MKIKKIKINEKNHKKQKIFKQRKQKTAKRRKQIENKI